MLERSLVRSAPGAEFTSAVVAALPALMAQSVAAATGGLAKASTSAKGAAALPFIAIWLGPVIGLLGGIFGTARSIRGTETPRERRFVVRMSVVIWVYVLVSIAILFSLSYFAEKRHWAFRTQTLAQCAVWSVYVAVLIVMVLKYRRLHEQLRRAEGLPPVPAAASTISPFGRFVSVAGATVGSLGSMFALAIPVGDRVGSGVIGGGIVGLLGWAWFACRKNSAARLLRFYFAYATTLAAFMFVLVNWRLHTWMAAARGTSVDRMRESVPTWGVNLLLAVSWVVVLALMWVTMRPGNTSAHEQKGANHTF